MFTDIVPVDPTSSIGIPSRQCVEKEIQMATGSDTATPAGQ